MRLQSLEFKLDALEEIFERRLQALEKRFEGRLDLPEERTKANKAELKAEIIAVKSDLSFNYQEKLGELENRLIRLERNVLPRIERLERETLRTGAEQPFLTCQ